MKITEEQIAALDTLKCVRISSDEAHLNQVNSFFNAKNQNLVEYLQGEANKHDEIGKTVCFLIKTLEDEILAYFSLKCGLLFDREGNIEKIEAKKKLDELLRKQQLLADDKNLAEEISNELNESINSLRKELAKHYQIDDEDIIHKRVAHTYSGIEIAHFCVNDRMRYYWKQMGMPEKSRPGATIFWYHVVPKILKVNEFIGAEYVYLFAADTSHDAVLVSYYKDKMNFEEPSNIFSVLPVYDFGCQLMSQRIENLSSGLEEFFNEFNPDSDAI